MMKILFLGVLQGLTEFLPVSSSGHLVIAQHFLKIGGDVLFLDIILHIGTLAAVLTYFFKDILAWLKDLKKIGLVVLITLITGAIGITFKETLESLFTSTRIVAGCLIINGIILLATKFSRDKEKSPGVKDSILMGIAQGIAITPGISRSGSTISALLFRQIKREEAFRFSFIASIPAIAGAFLLELKDIPEMPTYNPSVLALGVIASYVFGLIALKWLAGIVKSRRFHFFGYYCLALGTITLLVMTFIKPA